VLVEPLVITDYVLWELINGFSVGDDRPKAHAAIGIVRSNPAWQSVVASSELFEAGLEIHRTHPDKDWSLTDCISFVVMRRLGILRALTHDHHFEQSGFEALLRRDPS
jgi:predicted nucleic acid-binding protein